MNEGLLSLLFAGLAKAIPMLSEPIIVLLHKESRPVSQTLKRLKQQKRFHH
jgi:hypothetical protein